MVFKAEQQHFPGVKPIKKRDKKDRRGDGRKAIVALFTITVLASALFYLQAEAPRIWEKITAPRVISRLPKEHFDPSPVLDQIRDLTQDLSGTYGVYVYRFQDREDYGLDERKVFPAASLNKLPVMIAAYQLAEQGKINLETEYVLKETDKVQGAGVLQSKPAGTKYTYHQLIEYMAQYSDNTAFKVMRQVTEETTLDQATPEEIGILFKKLYEGESINQEHRDELLQFLTNTGFEDRIPKGVPEGARVAHKIGTLPGVYSDAGIIFAEKPFVLVIMTKDTREVEALEVLPKITRAVWEFETASP
ncbi:class A beta-lactamase-related serine hydrolase [Patescibacteria group bacterium]|nr:class A beta-lactamase-related serine hydrolase [Patescibacteria group bacterium]